VVELGGNRYGKAAIRVVRIERAVVPHRVRDLTVSIQLEGEFTAVHVAGDNSGVVATDTMKNTAYAFARDRLDGSIEAYAAALGRHFVSRPRVERATIEIREAPWASIAVDGATVTDAFVRSGLFTRTASARVGADELELRGGLEDLVVMKTSRSAFTGFPRDEYTTLAEADDRIMATRLAASWRWSGAPADALAIDHDVEHRAVRMVLTEAFAAHDSPSVQATLYEMARAVLERHPTVGEISMTMPNLHHWLVDLAPFGLDNPDEVYMATAEPHGVIEATVRRDH
jgi:urate oxidase